MTKRPRWAKFSEIPTWPKPFACSPHAVRSAFYSGEIAKAILSTARTRRHHAADDLAEFSAEWVEPISTTYRGWKVYELPPNGQGMAALEMLNIMEQFAPAKTGPLTIEEFTRTSKP